jgi:hypothetical protein
LFEDYSQARDLEHLLFGKRGDSSAAAGSAIDKTFLGKLGERFTHGDVTHSESSGERSLDEAFAWREFSCLDCVADLSRNFVRNVLVSDARQNHPPLLKFVRLKNMNLFSSERSLLKLHQRMEERYVLVIVAFDHIWTVEPFCYML